MMRSACGEQCSETVRRISPRSSLSVLQGSSLELRIFIAGDQGGLRLQWPLKDGVEGGN